MDDLQYRIDEKMKEVWIGDGFYLPFDVMKSISSEEFLDPDMNTPIPMERRELYAIARDELIERGLIREES